MHFPETLIELTTVSLSTSKIAQISSYHKIHIALLNFLHLQLFFMKIDHWLVIYHNCWSWGILNHFGNWKACVVELIHINGNILWWEDCHRYHNWRCIFILNLFHEPTPETRTSPSTNRMSHLKSLKRITQLRFLSNWIHRFINQLVRLWRIKCFSPVISWRGSCVKAVLQF